MSTIMEADRKKAALLTLGCKVNAYETAAMERLLKAAGYEIVDFKEKADVYIVNTCTVTNIADRKSRQMLHRARKQNPGAVIAAAGCYVQAAEEDLKKDSSVDLLIGNNQKHRIAEILEEYSLERRAGGSGGQKAERIPDRGGRTEYEPLFIDLPGEKTRAYIKIQDGCNQFCSYCIIPYARGRVRSRRPEEIMEEAGALVRNGYREVVLTGIHLSSYGVDLEPWKSAGDGSDFVRHRGAPLLGIIRSLNGIEGLERIRLGSLEPRIITEEFVRELADCQKLCPHFHLSLQSGCDETLKRMNRRYTAAQYRESCEILRAGFDKPALTTDVIVGFPGETQEEFEASRQFLEEISFAGMHIFKYSRRKGTRADAMEGQVSEPVKNERSEKLLALEKIAGERYRAGFWGTIQRVLLEESIRLEGKTYWSGHNERYLRLALEAEGGCPSGTFAHVRVVGGLTKDLLLCLKIEED